MALAELQPDQVANHQIFATAKDIRRHISPKRRDKRQDTARDDSGFHQRNDDQPQHAKGRGIKVIARLDKAKIQLFFAGKNR